VYHTSGNNACFEAIKNLSWSIKHSNKIVNLLGINLRLHSPLVHLVGYFFNACNVVLQQFVSFVTLAVIGVAVWNTFVRTQVIDSLAHIFYNSLEIIIFFLLNCWKKFTFARQSVNIAFTNVRAAILNYVIPWWAEKWFVRWTLLICGANDQTNLARLATILKLHKL
jgi:hypothetical protein